MAKRHLITKAEVAQLERSMTAAKEEIRALRAEKDALNLECEKYLTNIEERQRVLTVVVARAEKAEKANAALRAALTDLSEESCFYGDDCPTFGTRHGRCTRCKARAVLADPNLGADFVPRAELEAVKIGLRPELPPLPPNGSGLPRYGLHWPPIKGDGVLSVPLEDGYWTPWHLAMAELRRVAEAVREHCYAVWARDEYARLTHVDIDGIVAIVRGTR